MTEAKTVRIECTCNPDVHLGDGRRLIGPVRDGTKIARHGDVAEVSADVALLLIDNGQAQETKRPVTVA
jgi:hypothetical protein